MPEWFMVPESEDKDGVMKQTRHEWLRIVEECISNGMITIVDESILAMWCSTYARYIVACRNVAREGTVVETAAGGQKSSVWVQERNNSGRDLKGIAAELGFTPSSRSKVSVVGNKGATVDWSGLNN